MTANFHFNPAQVAYYEKAGWEAYYNRNWTRAFWLLVQLNREQFRMPWWVALTAALDTVRASMAFAPIDNDLPRAQYFLERFFAKARRSMGMQTEAKRLAALEMTYWIVHRQLAIRRQRDQADDNIEPMVQALTELHAALFTATPAQLRTSAECRALAAQAVDWITGGYSTNIAADWRTVEAYLRRAYQAVARHNDQ